MTEYIVLLPGDESVWANASAEQQAEMFERHRKFTELLEARGHQVTGGNELQPSSAAKTVTGSLDNVSVTDGPYAESAEQLGGYYTVITDNLDDLLKVCGVLADGGASVEVRPTVDHS
ncbi:transcription initiation protein [Nocardioides marmoriginsengisoli]|uniref:Transcription initiation protein n=1 Tax=Nocardioides marmoriginsengisoli TaxID=661483 RepID=A0A3N0CT24_9ACTN|nr:YciI family protein [Nocardioides marmoriginsengisoli]RNL66146.1 transcription initiation protein [Nocardioides marmoriginsengisoli]